MYNRFEYFIPDCVSIVHRNFVAPLIFTLPFVVIFILSRAMDALFVSRYLTIWL